MGTPSDDTAVRYLFQKSTHVSGLYRDGVAAVHFRHGRLRGTAPDIPCGRAHHDDSQALRVLYWYGQKWNNDEGGEIWTGCSTTVCGWGLNKDCPVMTAFLRCCMLAAPFRLVFGVQEAAIMFPFLDFLSSTRLFVQT